MFEEENKIQETPQASSVLNTKDDGQPSKTVMLRRVLENLRRNLDAALSLLGENDLSESEDLEKFIAKKEPACAGGEIIEGVFSGQEMIGPEGQKYTVPMNYASKSKLVEGDILKLTITPRGTFIFKQIYPIERNRIRGNLLQNQETGECLAVSGSHRWKILKASVTYFKGEPGDEVVLLVPKDTISTWAAVENIIKK